MSRLLSKFLHSDQSGGFLLLLFTIIALIIANSDFAPVFNDIWKTEIGFKGGEYFFTKTLRHWVDDGLMAVFFLLMGLEIKKEITGGELSNPAKAMLPGSAALGGMIVPAAIFIAFNIGKVTISGWGIPMATDIAFSVAVLSLVRGVPSSLRVFLITLAVVDDIGAIVIIAAFYSGAIQLYYLAGALLVFLILLYFNKLKIQGLPVYLILGILLWLLVLKSGIHATIAGVALAFAIPHNKGSIDSPLQKLMKSLHMPVYMIILPLFALANTGISLGSDFFAGLASNESLGIILGLVLGKPVGVLLFVLLALKLGLAKNHGSIRTADFLGIGFLCGIGYTMSIFISGLAYDDIQLIESSKISVLIASVISAIFGLMILKARFRKSRSADN